MEQLFQSRNGEENQPSIALKGLNGQPSTIPARNREENTTEKCGVCGDCGQRGSALPDLARVY
jgi:hypothetical protein